MPRSVGAFYEGKPDDEWDHARRCTVHAALRPVRLQRQAAGTVRLKFLAKGLLTCGDA